LLSNREITVAEYYASGQSYKQIARHLCISPATIRNHIASIYRKLEINSKAQLVCQPAPVLDSHLLENTCDMGMPVTPDTQTSNSSSYTCGEFPGFQYCPGKVQATTESELWQLIKIHAIVAHGESLADWTKEEIAQINALIRPCD